ncbi:hypothetical protein PG997_005453 [Apiospora hydei]|uniref:Uncharacterized protein n=1 Tax=Apiospora hydei TaxID=1337664 RepID=A0ABR1X514_9PEZI
MGTSQPDVVTIVSLRDRPDLWPQFIDEEHPINKMMKAQQPMNDLSHSAHLACFDNLGNFDEFRQYLLAAVRRTADGGEEMVGRAQAVPFHWPDLQGAQPWQHDTVALACKGLPDGGFLTVLAIAANQAVSRRASSGRTAPANLGVDAGSPSTADEHVHWTTAQLSEPPNLLSALEVAVLPEWRRPADLAVRLIRALRQAADDSGFPALVVPVRPTRKLEHAQVSIDEYISWSLPGNPALPYDPWLRKHVREGAQIVKTAPASEVFQGDAQQWSHYTQQDISGLVREAVQAAPGALVVDVYFRGGMSPIRWDVEKSWGVYAEPNVGFVMILSMMVLNSRQPAKPQPWVNYETIRWKRDWSC